MGSNLSDFDSQSWRVAREYDSKILKDIERGYKTWEKLDQCIDSTAWTYAKEMIPTSKANSNNNKANSNPNAARNCTTFNTFRKEGCSYEFNNPGERCVYVHACSKCKVKGHKSIYCTNTNNPNNPTLTPSVSSGPAGPVVTSV